MVTFKTFEEVEEKHHPSDNVYHEIVWWIQRQMTLDEWINLDQYMEEAFEKAGLADNYMGFAGPIPYPEKDTAS